MKYRFFALLLLPVICHTQLSAQVAKASGNVNYDTSYDVSNLPCSVNPKSLIGQQIYFFKRNQMFNGTEIEKDTIYQGLIAEKKTLIDPLIPAGYISKLREPGWNIFDYNTGRSIPYTMDKGTTTNVYKPILAISNMRQLLIFTPYSVLENKLFTVIDCSDSIFSRGLNCYFKFTLTDDHNEILHWTIDAKTLSSYSICFKRFIEHLQAHYPNKKFYLKADSWVPPYYNNPLDRSTAETEPGKEFICTDMTLVNEPQLLFPEIGLLFTSGDGKTLAVEPDIKPDIAKPLPLSAFWTEEEFAVYSKHEKKRQDSLVSVRKGRETRIPKIQPDYVKGITEKYGKDTARYIIRKEVVKGMTKAMCAEAWGTPNPKTVTRYQLGDAMIEVWAYSQYQWLRFKDDRLIWFNE